MGDMDTKNAKMLDNVSQSIEMANQLNLRYH